MSAGPRSGSPDRALPATDSNDAGQLLSVTSLAGGNGLRMAGEVDISSVALLERGLEDAMATAVGRELLLEMDEVGFMDVAGARVVAQAAERWTGGRRMVLRHPPRVLPLVLDFFPNSRARIEVIPR